MTLQQLHVHLQPLINFLGEICLMVLASAGVLYGFLWIAKRIWKYVLAAGAIIAVGAVILLSLGAI